MARVSAFRWLLGVVVAVALIVAGCGSSRATPGGQVIGPASAKVYGVDASFANSKNGPWKQVATGWYEPQTGFWSSKYLGPVSGQSVYTGTTLWESDDKGKVHLVTGSVPYVSGGGRRPGLNAPGVAVAMAWLKPDPLLGGRKGITQTGGSNGDIVLQTGFGNGSDTTPGEVYLKVVIHAPISAAEAATKDAFPPPPTKLAEVNRQTALGSDGKYGVQPYWLGRAADGMTARTAFEHWSAPGSDTNGLVSTEADEYQVMYRDADLPMQAKPGALPRYPQPDNTYANDLTVVSSPLSERQPYAEGEQEIVWHPATLADGEHAQVAVYQSSSVYVKTDSAIVHLTKGSWIDGETDCGEMVAYVASLVPVGYSGTTTQGSVSDSACKAPPLGLEGVPQMVSPSRWITGKVHGAQAPHVLASCPPTPLHGFTTGVIYQAMTCSPDFRTVSPYCYHFEHPLASQVNYPWYMSAEVVPTPGTAGCHVNPQTAVFVLREHDRGYQLLFLTTTPVCGPIDGPDRQAPTDALKAILNNNYVTKCG
jgi:hypothetical protein